MGLKVNITADGGVLQSTIMEARDEDARRLREHWRRERIVREDAEIAALQEQQRNETIAGGRTDV